MKLGRKRTLCPASLKYGTIDPDLTGVSLHIHCFHRHLLLERNGQVDPADYKSGINVSDHRGTWWKPALFARATHPSYTETRETPGFSARPGVTRRRRRP